MRNATSRFVLAAVIALIPAPSSASLITQSISVHFAEHGTSEPSYNKFDPTLGTLTGVTLEFIKGQATTSLFAFQNYNEFPVISTDQVEFFFAFGNQSKHVGGTFVDTFASYGARVDHSVSDVFSGSTTYTTGLSEFIATGPGIGGFRIPDVAFGTYEGGSATASVSGVGAFDNTTAWSLYFTEIITYTYLTPAEAVPEPGGVALVVSGLGAVLIRWAWRRRRDPMQCPMQWGHPSSFWEPRKVEQIRGLSPGFSWLASVLTIAPLVFFASPSLAPTPSSRSSTCRVISTSRYPPARAPTVARRHRARPWPSGRP